MLTQTFEKVNKKILPDVQPSENKVRSPRYTGDAISLQIARQVLAGTMDEAVSVLGGVGVKLLIPGTNFASSESIAAFFGVTDRYLRLLARRVGVIAKKLPNDVEYAGGQAFLKKHGIADDFEHNGVFYKSKDGFCSIRESFEAFFSARAILVLVCAMNHAKPFNRTVMNQNVGAVFADAANSVYGERARQEENMINANTPGEDSAILNKDGNLVLTLDFFTAIIKTTVREAVAEAVSKTSDPKMDERIPWLISAQEDGIITAEQAARILGVHRTTYFAIKSRYKSGK